MSNLAVQRQKIKEHILKVSSPKGIYQLFSLLNYPKDVIFDSSYIRKKDTFDFNKGDVDKIKEIYSVLSFGDGLKKGDKLPVFLVECSKLEPTAFVRNVTKKFVDIYMRVLLVFTIDYNEFVFVFPDFEKKEVGVSKLIITKLINIKFWNMS